MPSLTRRRQQGVHLETSCVYYGDVHVGSIGERTEIPDTAPRWDWHCGFCPGMAPGQQKRGIAATFEDVRARAFEDAWREILPKLTPPSLTSIGWPRPRMKRSGRCERAARSYRPKSRAR